MIGLLFKHDNMSLLYVRIKNSPHSPRKSVQIVESVRDGNKVKQLIVRYAGLAVDDQELAKYLQKQYEKS